MLTIRPGTFAEAHALVCIVLFSYRICCHNRLIGVLFFWLVSFINSFKKYEHYRNLPKCEFEQSLYHIKILVYIMDSGNNIACFQIIILDSLVFMLKINSLNVTNQGISENINVNYN